MQSLDENVHSSANQTLHGKFDYDRYTVKQAFVAVALRLQESARA